MSFPLPVHLTKFLFFVHTFTGTETFSISMQRIQILVSGLVVNVLVSPLGFAGDAALCSVFPRFALLSRGSSVLSRRGEDPPRSFQGCVISVVW